MNDPNGLFCAVLLKEVHKRVKAFRPSINLVKDAWTWKDDRRHYEFHGPDGFYWYGSAYSKTEARIKGWEAWLRKMGVEE